MQTLLNVLLFVFVFGTQARDIPNYIHICKRNDPHVSKCVRESVEFLRPQLQSGIPELSVPPLEPLFIKEIVIFSGNPPSNFQASLHNINIHGASNFKVTKLKIDVEKQAYRVGVRFDSLTFDGNYNINAKLLVVPIQGSGNFIANITDVEGHGVIHAEIQTNQSGVRELHFTKFDFAIRIADYNIHLDNLFDGDAVLGQAAHEVLHSNKKEFIAAALPFIQNRVAEILLKAANAITAGLNYDQVFPLVE